jgi:excisionase family DNA binding protein
MTTETTVNSAAEGFIGKGEVESYIGKPEVTQRLGMSMRTVDDWMKRGLLPYYKLGRSVLFKWSEIEAHLARTCRVCQRSGARAGGSASGKRVTNATGNSHE